MKRSSTNATNANVFVEPEVYQLPPKPQPKRKVSVPDSPPLKPALIKPPAPLPPGFEEKSMIEGSSCHGEVAVVVEKDSKVMLSAPSTSSPPPRPPKHSLSSLEMGSSSGEPSPVSGRRQLRSKTKEKSCERGVHFDPSLPKEEEPPPLPPREVVPIDKPQHIDPTTSSLPSSEGTPLSIKSHVVTVEATVESEGEEEVPNVEDKTPPPSYSVAMEMTHLSDCSGEETNSLDEGGGISDCTASTELGHEVLSMGGGGGRQGSPESCESTC